jgi:hypothetical protein
MKRPPTFKLLLLDNRYRECFFGPDAVSLDFRIKIRRWCGLEGAECGWL